MLKKFPNAQLFSKYEKKIAKSLRNWNEIRFFSAHAVSEKTHRMSQELHPYRHHNHHRHRINKIVRRIFDYAYIRIPMYYSGTRCRCVPLLKTLLFSCYRKVGINANKIVRAFNVTLPMLGCSHTRSTAISREKYTLYTNIYIYCCRCAFSFKREHYSLRTREIWQ